MSSSRFRRCAAVTLVLAAMPVPAIASDRLTPGEGDLTDWLLNETITDTFRVDGDVHGDAYRGCHLDRHKTGPCFWRIRVATRGGTLVFRRDGRAQIRRGYLVATDVPALRRPASDWSS